MPPIFSNPTEQIYGVGLGFTTANVAYGYTDRDFWYFGEPVISHVPAQPANITSVSSLWFTTKGAWGFQYWQTPDGRTYIFEPNGSWWRILRWPDLIRLVDDWRVSNPTGILYNNNLTKCGFLYLGLDYWRERIGNPIFPGELQNALSSPYQELGTVLKYLPKTSALPANSDTSIAVPKLRDASGGLDINTLLALSLFGSSRRTKAKRSKKRR